MVEPERHNSNQEVFVFDTTLRDGAQMPGISFTLDDRLTIAFGLADLGVDVIEAGFPSSSEQNFQAVRTIAEKVQGPVICAFSGTGERDIETAWEAIEPASHAGGARLNTCLPVSELHLNKRFGITPGEGLARAVAAVRKARSLSNDVEYSAEDASRADESFLKKVVLGVADAGASTIMIPDTVGHDLPDQYAGLIASVRHELDAQGFNDVVIAAHCHNDLGMAAANTWRALTEGGARQMDVTAGGIGERAGNASLELLAAIAREHPEAGILTGIDTQQLTRLVRMVVRMGGIHLQPHLPIVGRNAFRHASGWHQHGIEKDPRTFEDLDAGAYGQRSSELVISDQSGKAGIRSQLEDIGITVEPEDLPGLRKRAEMLIAQEEGRRLAHSDLEELGVQFSGEELNDEITLDFDSIRAITEHGISNVTLTVNDVEKTASSPKGMVDAAKLAINAALGFEGDIDDWDADAPDVIEAHSGSAVGVFIAVKLNGLRVEAYAVERSADFASIAAYLKGISLIRRAQRRLAALEC